MKRLPFLKSNESDASAKTKKTALEGAPTGLELTGELMVVFGTIILVLGIFLWWHYIASNPKRVFTGMLNTALQTSSGAVHITQTAGGQSLDQAVTFNLAGQHVTHAATALTQAANLAQTETIGTPFQDYVRYTAIRTSQRSASGKPLTFSGVIGVWGTAAAATSSSNGQLYNQVVLGVIPFGNLAETQRAQLLKLMQPVYMVNYDTMLRKIVHGRPTYTYTVQVMPEPYVIMLKQYGVDTGLTQLAQLNPASYNGSAPLVFTVTVDVWSRQLQAITYGDSNRVEHFSQFGQSVPPLTIPSHTVSIDELQSRLQTVQ